MTRGAVEDARVALEVFFERVASALATAYGREGYAPFPPGPVVPEGDDSTLFTSAGIQTWREWVLHGAGDDGRAGVQWCLRMTALDRVGPSAFLTSFCMVSTVRAGSVDRVKEVERFVRFAGALGLPAARLWFGVADGNGSYPADDRTREALDRAGIDPVRVVVLGLDTVQPFGPTGPYGSEAFVWVDATGVPCSPGCDPSCACARFFHIWNLEFLEEGPGDGPAGRPVADCAGSAERLLAAVSGVFDVYATPFLAPIVAAAGADDVAARVVADHCRSVALAAAGGVLPARRGGGHVVRRLARRAGAHALASGRPVEVVVACVEAALELYHGTPGFGGLVPPRVAVAAVEAECTALVVVTERGRRRYEQLPFDDAMRVASGIEELQHTHGVPRLIVDSWLREDGRALDSDGLYCSKP